MRRSFTSTARARLIGRRENVAAGVLTEVRTGRNRRVRTERDSQTTDQAASARYAAAATPSTRSRVGERIATDEGPPATIAGSAANENGNAATSSPLPTDGPWTASPPRARKNAGAAVMKPNMANAGTSQRTRYAQRTTVPPPPRPAGPRARRAAPGRYRPRWGSG